MKSAKISPKTSRVDLTPNRLLETLNQVWFAGLGAVSKARTEGPTLLNELVKEGARIKARARDAAQTAVLGLLDDVQSSVHDALNQLPPFRVLKEVQALSNRVDAIDAKIDKLASARRAPRKSRAAHKSRTSR
jgi:polyhydroxyalkanoate synthesis regulator phasin